MRCHQASTEEDAATGPLRTGARQADLLTALCRPPAPHTGGRSQESLPHRASPWNRTREVGKLEVLCLATILSRRLQYAITLPGTQRTPIYPKWGSGHQKCLPTAPFSHPPNILWGSTAYIVGWPLISRFIHLKNFSCISPRSYIVADTSQ